MYKPRLLYISMYGEDDVFNRADFYEICASGMEADWVLDWHGKAVHSHGFEFSSIDICRGRRLPDPSLVDAVILGGTIHDISEGRPWMLALEDWVLRYRHLRRPFLGICGGHQLVATRLFGAALKSRSHLLTGTYPIEVTRRGAQHRLLAGLGPLPRFHFSNRLHVIPHHDTTDIVLASHQESPAVVLDHGDNWFSCQFHPESRKQQWDCRYARAVDQVALEYTQDHQGEKLLNNFLDIAHDNGGRS